MNQGPPIETPQPGAMSPGPAAEQHLRRAAALTAELIDLVAHVRARLDAPADPPPPAPPEPRPRRGPARGALRDAFAAVSAGPRRQPRELMASPTEPDGGLSAT